MSELQGLQLSYDEFRRRGVRIVAIVVDPVERNAEVVANLGLSYPILADPELKAIDAYGVRHSHAPGGVGDIARPASFLLDEQGVVRWRDLTQNYRIRPRPQTILAQVDGMS